MGLGTELERLRQLLDKAQKSHQDDLNKIGDAMGVTVHDADVVELAVRRLRRAMPAERKIMPHLANAVHLHWGDTVTEIFREIFPPLFDGSQAAYPHPAVKDYLVRATTPFEHLSSKDQSKCYNWAILLLEEVQENAVVSPDVFEDVRSFMEVAGQRIPNAPNLPELDDNARQALLSAIIGAGEAYDDMMAGELSRQEDPDEDRRLAVMRSRIILEETRETLEALAKGDLLGLADGLADLIYVVVGTAHAYGIPLDKVWRLVHQANMAKFTPCTAETHEACGCHGTGYIVLRDAGGKVVKPVGWEPPDAKIADLLERSQG